jgi:RND superfamily putative drug exporter
MRPVSGRIARIIAGHYRATLALGLVAIALAAWFGSGVFGVLVSGGPTDNGGDAGRAEQILATRFPAARPNVIVLVDTSAGVDTASARNVGRLVDTTLAAVPGVVGVRSYFSAGDPRLRSVDGGSALVTAMTRAGGKEMRQSIDRLAALVAHESPGFRVRLGGPGEIVRAFDTATRRDLARSELIAVPLTLVALILSFRGLIAAILPLVVATFSVVLTMLLLRLIGAVVPLSTFSLNMSVALGFGLSIDYSLLMVRRFREELETGGVAGAVADTLRTAGRTVVFSAVIVSCAVCGLLAIRMDFLRSFAYAGVAVVMTTALASTTLLPALLMLAGRRVGRPLRLGRGRGEGSGWRWLATFVMRRPVAVSVAAVAVLATGAWPSHHVKFGPLNDQQLPPSTEAAQVQNVLRSQFATQVNRHEVVMAAETTAGELAGYARRLSLIPDVLVVDSPSGTYQHGRGAPLAGAIVRQFTGDGFVRLSVSTGGVPFADSERAVRTIRETPAPAPALVGGETASFLDARSAVRDGLPFAAAILAGSALVLIFLLTGSLLIPLKAVVVNSLSLLVPLGAVVWIVQNGHLRGLVGDFQVNGFIDITTATLAFCVAFGLSMDYEVFLLSRIREEYLRSGSTTEAVVAGLQRTGGVVTSAALLISIALVSLATSGFAAFKMLGIGLTIAVLVDASVVRCLLVPAVLRLFGAANWWVPAPLGRLHGALGLRA